ncbi:AAA family ATPase [Candidatus Woesearchaeota archaeon]|jgi:RecA/RadA recombinase|nr:AAA family ATPase [Candidatus Woesearchaeota archaeon]MBT4322347.1 AAA family ATPase [Candidatus Woesearchaeota archaeon]MBT4630953.1 AAA family ATPase [Candidatus Woesearchaeota archaeon]
MLKDKININGLGLVYGPSASGKSTWALQTSLEFAKKGKVLFFDTEKSFSIDRIKLMDKDYEKLLENLMIISIKDFDDQVDKINQVEELVKKGNFDYVVVDSFGFFYRHGLHNQNYTEVNEKAILMLRNLKHVINLGVPVLITNQVYSDQEGNIKTVGGSMIRNFSDSIFELETEPRKIIFHKPEKEGLLFEIDNSGIVF